MTSFDPVPWLKALERCGLQLKGVPLSSFGPFRERAFLEQLDPACPEHFSAALYRQLDLMVGAAFHSILFAVQAAVPVIAIDHAPKVRNFMEDVGLTRYLLSPNEYHKLPGLVEEVLAHRAEIASDLRAIRERLHREAQKNLASVREQIELGGGHCSRSGPELTVMVLGSGDAEKDERTLASCASQTYGNVKVLLSTLAARSAPSCSVGASRVTTIVADPDAGLSARLLQMLPQADGEYVTWVDGGDRFARDALDCLVSRLGEEPQRDVVYADYYAMDEANLPIGHHFVPGPDKLFRRDVVGPCFLMRRALLEKTGQPDADAPLASYDLWLKAGSQDLFLPFHAPLFYSARQFKSRAFIEQERAVRRNWRRARPAWMRAVWRVIDTDLGERLIVKPAAALVRKLRRPADG